MLNRIEELEKENMLLQTRLNLANLFNIDEDEKIELIENELIGVMRDNIEMSYTIAEQKEILWNIYNNNLNELSNEG